MGTMFELMGMVAEDVYDTMAEQVAEGNCGKLINTVIDATYGENGPLHGKTIKDVTKAAVIKGIEQYIMYGDVFL